MTGPSYADSIDGALDHLHEVGFEFGPDFAAHAPMAAETLVTLGYHELLPGWIERNKRKRHYYDAPAGLEPIPDDDPQAWRRALGDYRRVTDWVGFFDRRLAEAPWREVLVEWWARLLGGAFAAFTHGLIRTSHAVRSLDSTPRPSALQLHELARGLAYWAARYEPIPGPPEPPAPAHVTDVEAALGELTAHHAGRYAAYAPRPAVPLLHAVSAPAAVRLVLPSLPEPLRWRSYEVARRLAAAAWFVFPCEPGRGPAAERDYRPPAADDLVVSAVELGDEHAIKFAEACRREYALNPDARYLAASHTLYFREKRAGVI